MISSAPYESPELRLICGDIMRPGGLELTRTALDFCAFPLGARVADLACGAGATLKMLGELGLAAEGLELSPQLAADARQYGPVTEADFHHLPWADQVFDGLICECALSLARNKLMVLKEGLRVLKPGGRLILSDLMMRCPDDQFTGADDGNHPGQRAGFPAGVVPVKTCVQALETTGFSVEHCSDQSRALRELAARLVWHFGSTEILKSLCGASPSQGCPTHQNLTYALLIARKGDK